MSYDFVIFKITELVTVKEPLQLKPSSKLLLPVGSNGSKVAEQFYNNNSNVATTGYMRQPCASYVGEIKDVSNACTVRTPTSVHPNIQTEYFLS